MLYPCIFPLKYTTIRIFKVGVFMINLIIKDLKLQKKICIIGIAFYIFMIFSLGSASKNIPVEFSTLVFNSLYTLMAVYMVCLSVLYSDAYDEKNKSHIILNSLPINRGTIVISKYISLFIYLMIYLVSILIFSNVLKFVSPNLNSLNIVGILLSFMLAGLIFSIYYPLYFKIGRKLLGMYRLFIWSLVIIFPTIFSKLIKKVPLSTIQNFLNNIITNYKFYLIILSIIAVCAVILSCMLAIKLYNARDLD